MYKAFLADRRLEIERLFRELEERGVQTRSLRHAVEQLTEAVMPVLLLTNLRAYEMSGLAFFASFILYPRDLRTRHVIQDAVIMMALNFGHQFRVCRDEFDALERNDPTAAEIFGRLLGNLHPDALDLV